MKAKNLSTEHQKQGDATRPDARLGKDVPKDAPARSASDPAKERPPRK